MDNNSKTKNGKKTKPINEKFRKDIGRRINTLLADKRCQQKELAKYLDVPENTISYFCKGTRTPNTEQICKIAEFFNESADYLLGLPTMDLEEERALHFVCDYTGLNEHSINFFRFFKNKETGKTSMISNTINSLFSKNTDWSIMGYATTLRMLRGSFRELNEALQALNEDNINYNNAEEIFNNLQELEDSKDLCEYKLQKQHNELIEEYCKNEIELYKRLKSEKNEIMFMLADYAYGDTYDDE